MYEVEHVLQEGNSVFESSGKTLKLNRAQKTQHSREHGLLNVLF